MRYCIIGQNGVKMHQQKIKFLRELQELAKLTGAPGVKYNFVLR